MSRTTKVLIVEDEILIAKVMQIEMISKGYLVTGIATTIESAYEYLASDRPDIVTLDYNLSGRTTEALARFLKREHIPFIFATANPFRAISVAGFEPDGYVAKPFTGTSIADCLRSCLSSIPAYSNQSGSRFELDSASITELNVGLKIQVR